MHSVSKVFKFSAAHILPHHEGKCKRLHGHNYKVVVYAHSPLLNDQGMVVDFNVVKQHTEQICGEWDHRFLVAERYAKLDEKRLYVTMIHNGRTIAVPVEMVWLLKVPETTAEMLAWYIGNELNAKTHWNDRYMYYRVEVWETDDSKGVWEGPQ